MTRTARARMITYTEIAGLGCTTTSGSFPTWLYENLYFSGGTYAYWTSSANTAISNYAWNVEYSGTTNYDGADNGNYCGVCPVITI